LSVSKLIWPQKSTKIEFKNINFNMLASIDPVGTDECGLLGLDHICENLRAKNIILRPCVIFIENITVLLKY